LRLRRARARAHLFRDQHAGTGEGAGSHRASAGRAGRRGLTLTRFAADDLVAPRRCPGPRPLRLHRVRRLRGISRVAMALARRPAPPCARLGLLGRGLAQHLSADPARESLSPARRRGGIHRRVPRALPGGRALPARSHLAYSVAARRPAGATERRGLRPSARPGAVRTSASYLTIFSPVPEDSPPSQGPPAPR